MEWIVIDNYDVADDEDRILSNYVDDYDDIDDEN